MASKAMSAWPTISIWGTSPSSCTRRSRTTGESSTMKTGCLTVCFMSLGGLNFEIGFELVAAVGANAMAEANICMAGDIGFHPVPVIAVIPNLFAVTTNGQEALER